MIAAALAVAVLSSTPERRELQLRWQHASGRTIAASRRLRASPATAPPAVLLRSLAAAELATPGRYALTETAPKAKPPPTWWQRLLQWVRDRLTALWETLFNRIHIGRSGAATIGDVLIALAAVVLLVVAWRLLSELTFERLSFTRSTALESDRARAQELYERACAFALDGNYTMAARLLFSATVAGLDVRGIVRDDRSSTVGELRTALDSREPALVAAFNDVASAFVAGAYAERPVEAREWERARDGYVLLASDAA